MVGAERDYDRSTLFPDKPHTCWNNIPSPGDHRGNIVCGARIEVVPLTDREIWICEQVGPVLREKGLLFAGIDVIGDFMTEINVTSPTGIRELERAGDARITEQMFDAIASRLA